MRYQTTELPAAIGVFPTGETITVDVFDVSSGAALGSGLACSEIGSSGIYQRQLVVGDIGGSLPANHTEYVWRMQNANLRRNYGKFVLHGYPEYVTPDSAYPDGVWVDTAGGGSPGALVGVNGTRGNPCDNLADALTVAGLIGERALQIRGTITLASSFASWRLTGVDSSAVINLGGQDLSNATIINCDLSGSMTGSGMLFERCRVTFNLTGINGTWVECLLAGNLAFQTSANILFYNCAGDNVSTPLLDFAGFNNATISCIGWKGVIGVRNMSGAAAVADIRLDVGLVDVQASNTNGTTVISGVGSFTDNSGGGHVVTDTLLLDPTDPDLDWSDTEREEIRFRLGMNGVQTDPTLTPDLARQQDILSDATPFPGANIDATISSRNDVTPLDAATDQAEHDATQAAIAGLNDLAQSDILSDATPFPGGNIDVAISTRNSVVPLDAATDLAEHNATQANQVLILTDTGLLTQSQVALSALATAGGSPTEIRTNATQADNFFDGMLVVVVNAAGVAARRITSYANTNGAFTVDALPFTPANNDPVYVLSQAPGAGGGGGGLTAQQTRDAMKLAPTAGAPDPGSIDAELDQIGTDTANTESTVQTNLDVAVSSRNDVTPLDAATDQAEHDATQAAIAAQVVPMDAATSQAEHDATQAGVAANLAAIGAQNDLSQADVQAALDAQGYTAARAVLIDNLDALISSRATQADILSDATPFDGADIATILASSQSIFNFIEGGRNIDFVGNDSNGWQRVERDQSGTELRRYNLFDQNGVRITATVPAFIAGGNMIASEVAI